MKFDETARSRVSRPRTVRRSLKPVADGTMAPWNFSRSLPDDVAILIAYMKRSAEDGRAKASERFATLSAWRKT